MLPGPQSTSETVLPNLPLYTPQGQCVSLQELIDREFMLLIFLRHLT
jgi:hypothetical protein